MKKIRLTAVFVLLVMLMTACRANSLESYRKAAEKTEGIRKGQASSTITMAMDFDTTGMAEEKIKKLNYFKNIEGAFNVSYDEEAGRMISRNYLNMGGLGFDMDLYKNGEESFIKMPVAGKYVRLEDLIPTAEESRQPGKNGADFISQDTLDSLGRTWLDTLRQEDVLTGKQIILTTPDGEVKTTQYTIRLQDEQIKALIGDWTDALSKDAKLAEALDDSFGKNGDKFEGMDSAKLFATIRENLKSYRIEDFEYDAYADIDGYLVNETITFAVHFNDVKPGEMTDLNYRLEVQNWDIEKEQHFEFPVLTEENTMDADKLDQNMPSLFEDFFKKKD